MPRRLLKLALGLIAYGVSMVMMLQSGLGLMPWDVLHQGLAVQGGRQMGRGTVAVSFVVLLLGGTFGVGASACMPMIGPPIQHMLPWFDSKQTLRSRELS